MLQASLTTQSLRYLKYCPKILCSSAFAGHLSDKLVCSSTSNAEGGTDMLWAECPRSLPAPLALQAATQALGPQPSGSQESEGA